MISKRLKSLTKYIEKTDKLIDIGCDHALLDIYLIKNNLLNNVVVSDVHEGALAQGVQNIKKHSFEHQIETRLGNGLEIIDSQIDTVLISGMGTKTIVNILSHPKLKFIKKLIIQSNNDYYGLRKTICKLGFFIQNEEIIFDKGKYYINLVFLRGCKNYSSKELKYGTTIKDNKNYYSYLLKKEKEILYKIPKTKVITRLKIRREIINLKSLIK